MKRAWMMAAVSLAATAPAGMALAKVVTIADPSFESPTLSAGAYEYGKKDGAQQSSNGDYLGSSVPGLKFNSGSGIQTNGSAWGFENAPSGDQTAFLQSYDDHPGGKITQEVTGLTKGKTYELTFEVAERPGYADDTLTVDFGKTLLDTVTPSTTNWVTETVYFVASRSNGRLVYSVPKLSGDHDIGLDDISLSAVPEPAAWALMLVGFGFVGGMARARRSGRVTATA